MRYLIALITLAALLVSSGCTKDDEQGYRAAGITFRSDSGYTYLNDTVPVLDTLLVGAMIAEGSERLHTIYVEMRVNGGEWVYVDSVPFTENPMALDFQAIMGATPGVEDWGILAVERKGDATRRSLTFTVVE